MNWAEPFTLQSAAGATGNGEKYAVNGRGAVNVAISGTFSGTVTFEASHDGTDFFAVPALNRTTGVSATTATAPGLYYIALPGIYFIRARVSVWASGSITAIAVAVDMMAPPNEAVTLNGGDIQIGAVELKNDSDDTRAKVGGGVKANALRVTRATDDTGEIALTNFGAGDYEPVAAGVTDQMGGGSGAVGDFLAGVLIIPATLDPGGVSIEDGATNIPIFVGGTGSILTLHPFFVPLGIKSVSGGWEITTGANVSVIAIGNFT